MNTTEHVVAYAVCEQCDWRSGRADDLGPARSHALHFGHCVRTVREVRIMRDHTAPAEDGPKDLSSSDAG